jgi:Co/Zn/Cd efflux system component
MACTCSSGVKFDGLSRRYRQTLWIVIAINAAMFVIETVSGHAARSQALQADALDFLGDAATYGLTLAVIGRPLRWRARAAMIKGVSLAAFAAFVLTTTLYRFVHDGTPEPLVMGGVGVLALAANVTAALLLFRFRDGDANVRSVWLCSRNDAIGNVAVVLAAGGVWAAGSGWPDLVVATLMAALFLHSASRILRQAAAELRAGEEPAALAPRPACAE